ncbi:MAG TPA: divalent cation tolerance protein CutA [Arenimonas sp.]|jgi:uncharacterized protein involved in tolerance to divalent cations|nr:divalent cation tolerance protein CutA [Arenimonas sp.]
MSGLVLLHTTVAEAAALLRREHPYELPAIWTTPVAWAEPAYADWVATESQARP